MVCMTVCARAIILLQEQWRMQRHIHTACVTSICTLILSLYNVDVSLRLIWDCIYMNRSSNTTYMCPLWAFQLHCSVCVCVCVCVWPCCAVHKSVSCDLLILSQSTEPRCEWFPSLPSVPLLSGSLFYTVRPL